MAATTAHAFVPVEVYLRSSQYEPDAEYVDGEIEERPMGEYDHASWQQAIQRFFWKHEQQWGVRVRPELRVQVTPTRFRIPDVTVLNRSLPVEQVITHPPVAVFEVLSPEDTMTRVMRKLDDYSAMGIPQIWVIDPETKQAYRYLAGKLELATTFGAAEEVMRFEISEIEALLD